MKKNTLILLLFITTSLLAVNLLWPKVNNADVAFAQNMSEHHNQAIEMSFEVLAKSKNVDLRGLAYDIINTQATQRGMMMGWLQNWDEPLNSNIDHSQMIEMGMASDKEMVMLRSSEGSEFDLLFVELMMKHHIGGIKMAEGYRNMGRYSLQLGLAETMIAGQQAEIDYLKSLKVLNETN